MKKLFYAWQSDTEPNHLYIRHRLESAIKIVEGYELDYSNKNVVGFMDMPNEILEKINGCDLFLADVSTINPESTGRKCPNPNVMYELGLAVRAIGPRNIIAIANTTTTDRNDLIFDVRNRQMVFREFTDKNKETITNELVDILRLYANEPTSTRPTFELLADEAGWANWGMPHGQPMGGFRYHVKIDNFDGKADYISNIRVVATDEDWGKPWTTNRFRFDGLEADQPYKVEPGTMPDVRVFLTDRWGQQGGILPGIDHDEAKLVITLRSDGREEVLPIPPAQLQHN